MSGTLPFHPIANFWPLMEDEAFERLCKHMALTGYDPARPIILFQGMVLDGRDRYRAARRNNITPTFREWNGELGSPEAYVRAANFDRKHLAPSQIALMAVEYDREWMRKATGPAGPVSNTSSDDGASWPREHESKPLSVIAQEFGVSERTLKRANRVVAKGAPEVKAAVYEGAVSVADAASIVELPHEQQAEAVEAVRQGRVKTASAAARKYRREAVEYEADVIDVVDALGQRVPPHLCDVFATGLHRDIVRLCNELHRLFRSAGAFNPYLLLAAHLQGFELAAEHAEQATPFAVCRKCQGIEGVYESCTVCRRTGWMSKWRYLEAFPHREEAVA